MKIESSTLSTMPGVEMILKGIEDKQNGHATVELYLVEIASPLLVKAGLIDEVATSIDDEIKLYNLLNTSGETNAYGKYNSLMRRLASFEACLKAHLATAVLNKGSKGRK